MIEFINQIDLNIIEYIHNNLQNSIFDKVMPLVTLLGNWSCLWITIGVILLFSNTSDVLAGVALGLICSKIILCYSRKSKYFSL